MNDPPKNWNPRVWRSRDIPKRSLCVNRLLPILLLLSCGGPQRTDYDPGPEGIATTHLLSNTEFPHRVAEFRWQGNTLYDSEGMSASSEYRNRDGVLITVYVYPRPRVHPEPDADLRDELQQSIYAMESVHTDFNLLLQEPHRLELGSRFLEGYFARATGTQSAEGIAFPVQTELYLFVEGPWFFKFRARSPLELAENSSDATLEFLQMFLSNPDGLP